MKIARHTVPGQARGVTVFSDLLALYITDYGPSDRAILIGESIKHRLLLVVFIVKSDQEV
jgi:hypothetical protein